MLVFRTEKGDEQQPEAVDTGQQRPERSGGPEPHAVFRLVGRCENFVLAEIARGERQSGERGAADNETPECDRQPFSEPAHAEDIVFVMITVDNCPSGEEQKCLEISMGGQMKDGRGKRGYAQRQEHVSNLADGGVRQNPLDIALSQRGEACYQQRNGADYGDQLQHRGASSNRVWVRAIK